MDELQSTDPASVARPVEVPPSPAGSRATRSAEHYGVLALALVMGFGLVLIGLVLEPSPDGLGTHEQLGMPPCGTMEMWNLPCPGCGVTTSVTLATHGRFWESFANQPFGFALAVGVALFLLWSLWGQLTGRDLYAGLRRLPYGRLGIALGVFVTAAWIYKIWLVRR